MGLLNPSSWSKQGLAEWTYDTLDPLYGESGVFEDVTAQVREGDIVGAGLEAVETVFIEPVVDYVTETVVEPIIETGKDVYESGKEYIKPIADYATIAIIGVAYLMLSK
jgi:hypothetical protein